MEAISTDFFHDYRHLINIIQKIPEYTLDLITIRYNCCYLLEPYSFLLLNVQLMGHIGIIYRCKKNFRFGLFWII